MDLLLFITDFYASLRVRIYDFIWFTDKWLYNITRIQRFFKICWEYDCIINHPFCCTYTCFWCLWCFIPCICKLIPCHINILDKNSIYVYLLSPFPVIVPRFFLSNNFMRFNSATSSSLTLYLSANIATYYNTSPSSFVSVV